ncbi:hypothetical protein C1M55_28205 [Rhodococcus qingshengii]|uniref:hypothetical protein n=1 Tax=Rhodococcus qingshengii TaxID=334542 RepID=UPI000C9F9E4E|nr:hypothetical protein [Rhodococcus qingshengii]AUS34615.1 hypothetical protein C1M55_28205 [Rhodococcus qingshengii]
MRDLKFTITSADDATLQRLFEAIEKCECPGSWTVHFYPEGSARVRQIEISIQSADDATVDRFQSALDLVDEEAFDAADWTLTLGPRIAIADPKVDLTNLFATAFSLPLDHAIFKGKDFDEACAPIINRDWLKSR